MCQNWETPKDVLLVSPHVNQPEKGTLKKRYHKDNVTPLVSTRPNFHTWALIIIWRPQATLLVLVTGRTIFFNPRLTPKGNIGPLRKQTQTQNLGENKPKQNAATSAEDSLFRRSLVAKSFKKTPTCSKNVVSICFQNGAKSAQDSLFRRSLVAKSYKLRRGLTFSKKVCFQSAAKSAKGLLFGRVWVGLGFHFLD